MSNTEKMLEIKDLSVVYETDLETVYAVNGVTLSLEKGATLGLVGETGAGKTTLALTLMRLLPERTGKVTSGCITFEGENVVELPEASMRKIRGDKIAMIFQDPMTSLNPVLPGAAEGYRFMFTPDWAALKDPMIWIWAMGQAFFSLSVTGSGMIVYGAYLSKEEDVVHMAQRTALFDTIAAVVAALVIIPACFSYDLDVGAGPGLLFVTLPTILQDIPLGRLFAIILYVAMIFAGVSSLQNMFEAVAESLLHKFPKLNRTAALAVLCVLCLGAGLFMEPIAKWGPWMDLVSIYIIPIGATLGAVSWFYVMKKDDLLTAINTGSHKTRGALWYSVGRYVYVPLALVLCLVALIGGVAF